MSPSFRLPPSERDLEVYESVSIAGLSLRMAAASHKISVARVRQIVHRVSAWLAESLPTESTATREKHLQLARNVAADRLHYAYGELMELWRRTGNTAFLLKTSRLSLALARLGVVPGTIEGVVADAWEAAESAAPPPLAGDCAPGAQKPSTSSVSMPPPGGSNELTSNHLVTVLALTAAQGSNSVG